MTGNAHDDVLKVLGEGGLDLYARALQQGGIPAPAAPEAPRLVRLGLLNPALDDPDRLEPVAPHIALHRLLRASADRVAEERRREERLVEALQPLLQAGGGPEPATALITLHSDKERIGQVIDEVMAEARELLAVQPYNSYTSADPALHEAALRRDQALLDRGGRIRALYQHTLRHAPRLAARYERLTGDVEARTLDEITERLIVIDRTVALVPANADRSSALEVRHPALVGYLATTFDRLWRLATPMYPQAVTQPTLNGVTPRQRAIAALLVEGHTDAVIADRLGMNVRTARVHIAKLAATLGSQSRAQLGYLIGRSGILDPEA
ncbi:helix-turn-helix transcriptional regulator [Streptomyces calvus]|jgi:DNA-binding CsgD family transcriptional regulator|uniref:helix-turn-helix transcriptional regulator n=1 Tax=Streptomyces calvus TaxID=67282 RepID=UPI0035122A53